RDERIDVDVAVEVALDELRDLVAALDAAEARAAHAPALDQVARDDVERLPLAGDARDRAQAPAHARGLDRLLHHMHEAGRVEGVAAHDAAGLVADALDDVLARHPGVGRALALGELEAVVGEVDADDPAGALQARAGDGSEADHAGAEDDAGGSGLDLGRVH